MSENYSIVIIPTYNEIDNISDIIDEVFSLNNNFHVLVVDDNSPDKTYKIVEEKIVEHKERLFLIKRDQKSGLKPTSRLIKTHKNNGLLWPM